MNKNYTNRLISMCLLLALLSSCISKKQLPTSFNYTSGIITDKDGVAIPGVTIFTNKSKAVTSTDQNGRFYIYCSENDTLHVSYLGYATSQTSLSKTPATIKMGDLKVTLSYKNISNVSAEKPSKVPINTFAFPPIEGYTQISLDIKGCKDLEQIDKKISFALISLGYDEKSYFLIPDGFAVVTRIESINIDGTSILNSERFSINESKSMSFKDFLSPRQGDFRMFIFIVTDIPFKSQSGELNVESLSGMSRVGYNVLPINKSINQKFICTTLVYEFHADKANTPISIVMPRLSANVHLVKSNLLPLLISK